MREKISLRRHTGCMVYSIWHILRRHEILGKLIHILNHEKLRRKRSRKLLGCELHLDVVEYLAKIKIKKKGFSLFEYFNYYPDAENYIYRWRKHSRWHQVKLFSTFTSSYFQLKAIIHPTFLKALCICYSGKVLVQ